MVTLVHQITPLRDMWHHGKVFLPLLIEDLVHGGTGGRATHIWLLLSPSGDTVTSMSNEKRKQLHWLINFSGHKGVSYMAKSRKHFWLKIWTNGVADVLAS